MYRLSLHWSTVVGDSVSTRDLHVVRNGERWQVDWPIAEKPNLPPQVIPVNYLRWDVIYRGAGDDWGAQDVEAPHVRIIDMHPVQRAEGLVILGELLNEDVVPAYVSVNATLLNDEQQPIATEGSFDKISAPAAAQAVTPFLIHFPDVTLSQVAAVRMNPFSTLIPASADPVIEIQNEQLNPAPDASLTGEVVNQSGEIVNVAHVMGTFYDKSGNLVWVADQYVDRALLPQTPVPFQHPHPGGSGAQNQQPAHGGFHLTAWEAPLEAGAFNAAGRCCCRAAGCRRRADLTCPRPWLAGQRLHHSRPPAAGPATLYHRRPGPGDQARSPAWPADFDCRRHTV